MGKKQRLKQQRRAQRQAQRGSEAPIRQPEPARRAQRQAQPDTKATTAQPEPARRVGRAGYAIEALAALLVAGLIVAIYANSLSGPFIFDDRNNILDNVDIRITSLSPSEVVSAGLDSINPRRFVAYSSFALNYYFGKFDTFGYRLVNVLIHIVTGVLLYYLVKTTLSLPVLRDRYARYREIALFVALIWLVHPLAVQSVAYVVQRMNSLAALFFVLSLLLYVQARLALGWKKWVLFSGSALSGFLALGSKENAAMLPLFIFLYEWYFLQDLSWPWLKRRLLSLPGILVLAVPAIIVILWLGANPLQSILAGYNDRYYFTLGERVLTELRVVIHYLSIIVFPHPSRLSLDKDFPLSHSLVDPITTLLSLVVIVGLFWLAWVTAKRDRLVSFCILWFLGNLVIESSVYALDIIFEHRTYLPSIGIIVLVVLLVYRYVQPRWVPVVILGVVVAVFSVWAHERSGVWADRVAFWQDEVAKSPGLSRPHSNLGVALRDRGRVADARIAFEKAVRLDPRHIEARRNLATILFQQKEYDEGTRHAYDLLHLLPEDAVMRKNLAVALIEQGRIDEAIEEAREAVRSDPKYHDAHNTLGVALKAKGSVEDASQHFAEAVRLMPDDAGVHGNLGAALVQLGRLEEGIEHLHTAVRIQPELAIAQAQLGAALLQQGHAKEAVPFLKEALRLRPEMAFARDKLEVALQRLGEPGEEATTVKD